MRQPFKGSYGISLDFGDIWEPVYTKEHPHKGIDYLTPYGTPVLASADGRVLKIGWEPNGYGNYILILHNDKTGTIYAHLSQVATFNGASVKKGELIGYTGSTGNSSGPHLHFEYRTNATDYTSAADPKPYMQSVVDVPVVQQKPEIATTVQRISGGLCEVSCDEANIRDAESFLVVGRLFRGAKVVVSPDVVMFRGLPYHKIFDDYMLIAEYDGYGTEIIKRTVE